MKKLVKVITIPSILILSIIIFSCSTGSAINDLYGIKMDPVDTAEFKILSYSEDKGIEFESSPLMEPEIFAWGEFDVETLTLIIQNNSPVSIPSGYATDAFYLVTKDGKEYGLMKGGQFKYPTSGELKPNMKMQLTLKLPREYRKVVEEGNQKFSGGDLGVPVVKAYDKGIDYSQLNKGEAAFVKIILGGKDVIILKPVP